ncbi:MAG: hypothetical protein ACM3WS_02715, partial [Bacillota bacterium]
MAVKDAVSFQQPNHADQNQDQGGAQSLAAPRGRVFHSGSSLVKDKGRIDAAASCGQRNATNGRMAAATRRFGAAKRQAQKSPR